MLLGLLAKAQKVGGKYYKRIYIGKANQKYRYFYNQAEWEAYSKEKQAEAGRKGTYVNEKPADINNVGEDVWGAARHNFDTYDPEQIEKSGMGEKIVRKAKILGDFQLDEDKRKEMGESVGKIASAYAVKQKLLSAPPDDPEYRKKYLAFCRLLERADDNTKTAKEFLETLRTLTGIKPGNQLAREEAERQGKVFSEWGFGPGWEEAAKRKKISEKVVGKQLVKFMDSEFSRVRKRYRMNSMLSYDQDVDVQTAQEITAKDILNDHNIPIKGAVKLGKGDSVKIKDVENFRVTGKQQSSMYAENREQIKKIYDELTVLSKKIKRTYGTDRDKLATTYNEKVREYNRLQGKGKVKVTDTGMIEKKKEGKYIVRVTDERGDEHLIAMNASSLELVVSGERGRKVTKGKPDLVLDGKVTREGGTEVKGTALELQAQLAKDVNMRGLQYGNSMTEDERAYHTKWTLESFYDLSDVTGIPVNDLTMDGRLAMAFGARGRAGALAHYEPGAKIINLTRHSGFGSLAHEYGHFLDNAVSNLANNKKDTGYASAGNLKRKEIQVNSLSEIPQGAIVETTEGKRYYHDPASSKNYPFKRLRVAEMNPNPKASQYRLYSMRGIDKITIDDPTGMSAVGNKIKNIADKAHSRMKDKLKGYKPYWSRREELLARSFECYVSDKLREAGRENTYLAAIIKTSEKGAGDVYPQGELRKELNKDFDDLFNDIRNSQMLKKAKAFYGNDILRKVNLNDQLRRM